MNNPVTALDKAPVFLREYSIAVAGDSKKRAQMKFVNLGGSELTGVRFSMRQLDAEGTVLEERIMGLNGLSVKHLNEFETSADVRAECVSVEVLVESVSVRVQVENKAAAQPPAREEVTRKKDKIYSVTSRKKRYILIILFAIFVFFALAVVLAWRGGYLEEIETNLRADAWTYAQVDTGNLNYAEI